MEDNIQTIIVVIISAFLLFIFPVYLAYEKKDDISYALAMRYTQDLVDEVRNKGYITEYMYEDYRAKLKVTGNSYDIELTHEYNRYDPITNYYSQKENGEYVLVRTSTQKEREQFEQEKIKEAGLLEALDKEKKEYIDGVYESMGEIPKDTYKYSKEVYTTDHIVSILKSEKKLMLNSTEVKLKANNENLTCKDSELNTADKYECQYAYTMNVDDNFNITIKNTNTTLATVIYNMVTANTLDSNTRIYVNYGGTILSSKWYGDVDYTEVDHDKVTLNPYREEVIIAENDTREFTSEKPEDHIEEFTSLSDDITDSGYILKFSVKPEAVTELKPKGKLTSTDYAGFNFCIGNSIKNKKENVLSVSVGVNGISLLATNTKIDASQGIAYLPTYEYKYFDAEGIEHTETRQREFSDYTKIKIVKSGTNTVSILADGANIGNITVDGSLFSGLDYTINPSTAGTYEVNLDANRKCTMVLNGKTISVTATRYTPNQTVILSYPYTIQSMTEIKIDITKNEKNKYVAVLYIDDERVAESAEMTNMPIVNVVGETVIGNSSPVYFKGKITDVRLSIK